MNVGKIRELVKTAGSAWIDDGAPSMGAALAYYTVFSIAPLLLLLIALAGMFFGAEAARGDIVAQLGGLLGKEGATAVEGMLKSASDPQASRIATAISFVTLLVGATTVFAELQSDLDRIWKAPPAVRPAGIWGMLRTRFLSFGMILGIGFLLIVSLALSAALAALGKWWSGFFGGWEVLLQAVNFAVSFGVVTAMFAMVYKIMPSVPIRWRDVWIGAAVTSLLFTVGKLLIGLYLGKSGVASGFGAAGSLIVLLVWVYYSTQIFLLGAEFTYAYAHSVGSKAGEAPKTAAAPGAPAGLAGASAGQPAPAAAPPTDGKTTDLPPSWTPAVGRALEQPAMLSRERDRLSSAVRSTRDQTLSRAILALAAGWVIGYAATGNAASQARGRVGRALGDRGRVLRRSLERVGRQLARR